MQWSDAIRPASEKTLRQFAALCLIVFGSLAAWRAWQGRLDLGTVALAVAAAGLGVVGLARPSAIRPVYTGWMIAAFPIGWVISQAALALLFYAVFTPAAFVFRLAGRDVLHRRRQPGTSYWAPKTGPSDVREYFRQF